MSLLLTRVLLSNKALSNTTHFMLQADAIVNTVASDLDLTKNKSAIALSNAAGPKLQQECKGKGPLKTGEVLSTEGFSLGCKNVFHVVAAIWENGKGEKVKHVNKHFNYNHSLRRCP